MRVLLLGKHGQLGWELHRALAPLGDLFAIDFPVINMTSPEGIRQIIQNTHPDVIVNSTAYTRVDRSEREPELAFAINSDGPRILAEQAKKIGAAVIHYSTDYVFDGKKGSPYIESDFTNPLSVYGKSKLSGEQAISQVGGVYLILRTCWLYSLRANNFLTKVLRWSRQQDTLRIVEDQIGSPTWARMLAEATAELLAAGRDEVVGWIDERKGIYHLAGSGTASRLDWARATLRCDPDKDSQITRTIMPALSADFPTAAERPLFSALNCDHFMETFGLRLPDWESTLRLAMDYT